MRKLSLLLGVVSIFIILVFSCNESTVEGEFFGLVSGTVYNSDHEPLEGVSISTTPGSNTSVTTSDGTYDLGEIKAGDYTISASKDGYRSENLNISVREGDNRSFDILMRTVPVESNVPVSPTNLAPQDKSLDHYVELELVWQGDDPDDGDTLRYDVWLFDGDLLEGRKVVENTLDTTFVLSGLNFDTSYYWQVVARNKKLEEVSGEKWSFQTKAFPVNSYFFVREQEDNSEIFSTNLSELDTLQLTNDPNPQFQPRRSPRRNAYNRNDELLAFSSLRDGQYHLFTMRVDGRDVTQITDDFPIAGYHNRGMGFCWSPAGEYIIYPHNSKLYIINENGTGIVQLYSAPSDRHFRECHWSAYGDKLVVLTQGEKSFDNEIYLFDIEQSPVVKLKNMTLLVDNLPGTIGSPSFSIKGDKVIFTHDVSEMDADDGRQFDTHIFSIDLNGENLTDLSGNKDDGTLDLQPRYSPDGSKIIFVNTSNYGSGQRDIYVMDDEGTSRELIISNAQMPEWN